MEQIYFNIITRNETKYKYRFKTKDEFIKYYGSNWRNIGCGFIDDMDYLLGCDYPYNINNIHNITDLYGWSISYNMLIENENHLNINNYFKNKNIYENIDEKIYFNNIKKKQTIYPYRFKTIDEMKNEYINHLKLTQPNRNYTIDRLNDYDWRRYIMSFFSASMNYLSGEDLIDDKMKIYDLDSNYVIFNNYSDGGFMISTQMIIENNEISNYKKMYNKRKNIYENNIIKLNEFNNEIYNSNNICIYIDNKEDLIELEQIIYDIDNKNHELIIYQRYLPVYIFYDLNSKTITWLDGNEDNINEIGIENVEYLNNVYKKIFKYNNDKDVIKNIIKHKKIDYIPYFIKTPTKIYETINNTPIFFKRTYYRLPNDEELANIDECNLNAKEIVDGFIYTIVGRGILKLEQKNMIIKSIKMLIDLNQNNIEYIYALKKAEKIILK